MMQLQERKGNFTTEGLSASKFFYCYYVRLETLSANFWLLLLQSIGTLISRKSLRKARMLSWGVSIRCTEFTTQIAFLLKLQIPKQNIADKFITLITLSRQSEAEELELTGYRGNDQSWYDAANIFAYLASIIWITLSIITRTNIIYRSTPVITDPNRNQT